MEKKTTKKATKKAEKKAEFKEFQYTGKVFEYTGRIYPSREGKGKVVRTWGMQLVLNGVFTLKGVKLVETESTVFLNYPQYADKDGNYKSYVFIDKDLNGEIDGLINVLMGIVGIDGDGDDEEATDGNTSLPF